MNILWLSVRRFGIDLCGTTQVAILDELTSVADRVEIWSRGQYNLDRDWEIRTFADSGKRGFQTKNLAMEILENRDELFEYDHVLIDWPLVKWLKSEISQLKSWSLIDRSPPADEGLVAKLHWSHWKYAWKLFSSSTNTNCAMVVSQAHLNFIRDKLNISSSKIKIVQAGVDTEKFTPLQSNEVEPVKLVYHGKLDTHRGVLSLPFISHFLSQAGVRNELHLIGTGSAEDKLVEMAKSTGNIFHYESMSHNEISEFLKDCHVGCLPMPADKKMWTIASPLKLSEYLSSGLIVVGIDHSGHRLNSDIESVFLSNKDNFVKSSADWIKSTIINQRFKELSSLSRNYAETNLHWKVTSKQFIEMFKNQQS